MSDFPLIPAIIGLFLVGLVVAICVHSCKLADECEAKGGQWYRPYKSSGICLKPGTVMP